MLVPALSKRVRRAGAAFVLSAACLALPASALSAPVNLGTAAPFVVLAGSAFTNTGPSVLNGDLGVSPGTSTTGIPPAVLNGARHVADAVARQAKDDLTTAYVTAAAQPAVDLSAQQDLGNRSLTPGAYKFISSAQLTGPVVLDAQGDPSAQFVFEIGSTLTTASGSSVVLINGANPCNVYWQVGSSATLGSTTAFQGNILALASITLNSRATVIGRVLARNGAVTLIDNVLDSSSCGTPSTPGAPATPGSPAGQAAAAALEASNPRPTTTRSGTTTLQRTAHSTCTSGFRATVRGHLIKRVVFTLDHKNLSVLSKAPYTVFVRALPGLHRVRAHVSFKDATPARTLALGYRACADAVLTPLSGPSGFTG